MDVPCVSVKKYKSYTRKNTKLSKTTKILMESRDEYFRKRKLVSSNTAVACEPIPVINSDVSISDDPDNLPVLTDEHNYCVRLESCEDIQSCWPKKLKTYSKTTGPKPSVIEPVPVIYNDLDITITDDSDNLPPLVVEYNCVDEDIQSYMPSGRRIVDIGYLFKQMEQVFSHPLKCTGGKMVLKRETRDGIKSTLHFECRCCEKTASVLTEPQTSTINTSFVWGSLNIGIGYSQAQELCGIVGIPFMSSGTFQRHEKKVGQSWKTHLCDQMSKDIEIERQLAIENNEIDEKHPYITVIVDGGWSRRSYGHSFSAKSGVACIIGKRTGKLLYLGVKNKYCHICTIAANEKKPAKKHECNISFSGPSTGMEQTIVVEGLNYIFDKHQVWVKFLIGDGDSSVFARVRERAPFGYKIKKMECANHMVKCYTSKLYTMVNNVKYDTKSRSLLRKEIKRLKSAARCAIKRCEGNITQLKLDLKNGPNHVFGEHSECRADYCKKTHPDVNNVPYLEKSLMMKGIRLHLDGIIQKADRLVTNVTTNSAENYMSLVSKVTGGKRVDFSRGSSYKGRCYGAGLAHSLGSAHILGMHKNITGMSPSQIIKSVVISRLKRQNRLKARRLDFTSRYKKPTVPVSNQADCEYGPHAADSDIPQLDLQEKMKEIMESLQAGVSCDTDCKQLQLATVGQSENYLWIDARHKRLTASKFGNIFKMRNTTPRHNTVKNMLFPSDIVTKDIMYGRKNERTAIALYEAKNKVTVMPCGLFVRTEFPFLGASPDGLIGENGLIEVKCLPSIGSKPILEAALQNNILCLTIVNSVLHLKESHNYWFQIQGQLYIAKKEYCDLIVYADSGIKIIRLLPDPQFETRVLPRLISFYNDCLLPELADSRIQRGMRIREPEFILNNLQTKAKKIKK
jgi:hypothetical protein